MPSPPEPTHSSTRAEASWLRGAGELVVSPLAACLLLALVWLGYSKLSYGVSASELTSPSTVAFVVGTDLYVFAGIGLGVALVRSRKPHAAWIFAPIVVLALLLAIANGAFLRVTGEQGGWYDLVDAYTRRGDLLLVLGEIATWGMWGRTALAVAVFAGVFYVLRRKVLAGDARELSAAERARMRAKAWVPLFVLGLVASLAPPGSNPRVRLLGKNVVLMVGRFWVGRTEGGSFVDWGSDTLVDEAKLAAFTSSPRPNLLLVVLESTRYDHTSLAGKAAPVRTPALESLATRGLQAESMRAIVPHTSKSLFSLLCGREPTLQRQLLEIERLGEAQCLPHLLAAAGYDTLFAQSADGTFEMRPRLVHETGFANFRAWEQLGGHHLGYVSSDDRSLAGALEGWLDDRQSEGPFFATLLTSATHHAYELPPDIEARAREAGVDVNDEETRYNLLVETSDAMLAELLAQLDRRGLRSNTIVVVVGDHGEGFGEFGVREHDQNYFEEGLHVPFVMAGPGIERMRQSAAATLADVVPTVLGALELAPKDGVLSGFDLRSEAFPTDRPRFFSCFDTGRCRGFVRGSRKYVEMPRDELRFAFDLDAAQGEGAPLSVGAELEGDIEALRAWVEAQLASAREPTFEAIELYGEWSCQDDDRCLHPNAWSERSRP